MKPRKYAPFAVTAALALALGACSSTDAGGSGAEASGGDLNVIVVTPYLGNATTKEAIDHLVEQGGEQGINVTVTDTAGDMNELNSAFSNAAAQKPDAIIMGAGDPTQVSLGLRSAADAQVPVFAFDAAPAEGILANVTSDNTNLGEISAGALIDLLGGEGSVIMLTHDPHPGVRARAEGAKAAFEHAGIEILESKHVDVPGPVDSARSSMQDLISALGGEIGGVWGGWDEPALGSTQALEAAGLGEVPVVGVDGQDFALEEMAKGGPFRATVKQDWKAITQKVLDLISAKVNDGTDPDQQEYELPGQLVTVDDLE